VLLNTNKRGVLDMIKKVLKIAFASTVLFSVANIQVSMLNTFKPITVEASNYPSGTLTPSTTVLTGSSVTINAQGSDSNGIKGIRKPDGSYVTGSFTTYVAKANGTYYFDFENTLGNITTKSIKINNIDSYPPFIWSSSIEPETITRGNVTIYINAGDDAGVKQIILPNGSTVTHPNTSYTVSQNGNYTFKVEDYLGRSTNHTVSVENIDKTAPSLTSLALHKDIDNYYSIDVKADDDNDVSTVTTNAGQTLTADLEDSSHFFINKVTSANMPSYINLVDTLGNISGNISFLDIPTVVAKTRNSVKDDVTLEINGTGTLSYKKDYKNYTCSTKPCLVTVKENTLITAYNQSGAKYASVEYQVGNIDKTTTKFTLSGKRNTSNASAINLSWNQTVTNGTIKCETPEGLRTFTVSGASYTINGKNYDYNCSIEATLNGVLTKSNWLQFSPDYNQTVVFTKPSGSIPNTTLSNNINIFIEQDGTGATYFINSRLKNTSTTSIPIPTGLLN